MHFSLAQNNIKYLHSCSKVWFGLSTEVCAAIITPAFLCRRFHVSQFQSTQAVYASKCPVLNFITVKYFYTENNTASKTKIRCSLVTAI